MSPVILRCSFESIAISLIISKHFPKPHRVNKSDEPNSGTSICINENLVRGSVEKSCHIPVMARYVMVINCVIENKIRFVLFIACVLSVANLIVISIQAVIAIKHIGIMIVVMICDVSIVSFPLNTHFAFLKHAVEIGESTHYNQWTHVPKFHKYITKTIIKCFSNICLFTLFLPHRQPL